jgi:hypothetical protein
MATPAQGFRQLGGAARIDQGHVSRQATQEKWPQGRVRCEFQELRRITDFQQSRVIVDFMSCRFGQR